MMNCRIEKICGGGESAWMIALSADAAAHVDVEMENGEKRATVCFGVKENA